MPLAFYVAYKSKFSYMNSKQVMNHAADNIRILAPVRSTSAAM